MSSPVPSTAPERAMKSLLEFDPALPDLGLKKSPVQARAVETYERILAACAELLGEIGIERLSTNLVCQRAGISPPGLYQYFPNKYAIIHELGMRHMRARNELLKPWALPQTFLLPEPRLEAAVAELFLKTYALSQQGPGGVWVARALRAVPTLQPVRSRSQGQVTEMLLQPLLLAHPRLPEPAARLTLRLSLDALYAAQELLFDDPELDPADVARTMAQMVCGQLRRLLTGAG